MSSVQMPSFAVVSGAQVQRALSGRADQVIAIVEHAYHLHGGGATVNPASHFLRFPDRPGSRIIALPASVGGDVGADGIKWIASFPENVTAGMPRASAVLILNDPATGYPVACLEASIISATRTAASAVLAADRLTAPRGRPSRIGLVGAGLIARYLHTYLTQSGWVFDEVGVYDIVPRHADGFADYLDRSGTGRVVVHKTIDELVSSYDLVSFTTVAGQPYVHDAGLLAHNPVVLNISLRDLAAEIVLESANIVDDIDHCLRANTSPHLAEQLSGDRGFITGTLYDVLTGQLAPPPPDRPLIFSPFGLGVLDIAVGRYVYQRSAEDGQLTVIEGFFTELDRYGRPGTQSVATEAG